MAYSGFCVGGVDWVRPELVGVDDPSTCRRIRRQTGHDEARMTHDAGGNLMRASFSTRASLRHDRDALELAFGSFGSARGTPGSYPYTLDERVARLDEIDETLDRLVDDLEHVVDLSSMGGYIAGVEDFNAERAEDGAVRVLLVLELPPPRWILESPPRKTLKALERSYSFDTLWNRYLELHERILRLVVRHCLDGRARPALCAVEVGNEPDYNWIPEEMKIEGFEQQPLVYPLWKYVTELHLDQIPAGAAPAVPFQSNQGGYFQPQEGEWSTSRATRATSVASFDWGA